MPGNDVDLTIPYSSQDYTDVSSINSVWVSQTAVGLDYAIHLFKDFASTAASCMINTTLQTDIEPTSSTVYLQIFNYNTSSWETIDSNNTSPTNTNFSLNASIPNLTNYKNGDSVTSCRVWQLVM